MEEFYKNARVRIRVLREQNNYTRETLAELADISPKFLYEIENGYKGFSAITLHRLATALSVSCEYIVSGNTDFNSNKALQNMLSSYNSSQINVVIKLLRLINQLNSK